MPVQCTSYNWYKCTKFALCVFYIENHKHLLVSTTEAQWMSQDIPHVQLSTFELCFY